jgi:hypothetical protein
LLFHVDEFRALSRRDNTMTDDATEGGGCLCGAIRYEVVRADVMSAHHCYCRDCQRSTGGGVTTFCMVPQASFKLLQGRPKSYEVTGESGGTIARSFCPDCGSPVFSHAAVAPGFAFVKAGTLDRSDWLQIASSFWGASAQPWILKDERYPIHEGNPK